MGMGRGASPVTAPAGEMGGPGPSCSVLAHGPHLGPVTWGLPDPGP